LAESLETDIRAPGGVRTRNSSKRAVTDQCLSPRGYRDRLLCISEGDK